MKSDFDSGYVVVANPQSGDSPLPTWSVEPVNPRDPSYPPLPPYPYETYEGAMDVARVLNTAVTCPHKCPATTTVLATMARATRLLAREERLAGRRSVRSVQSVSPVETGGTYTLTLDGGTWTTGHVGDLPRLPKPGDLVEFDPPIPLRFVIQVPSGNPTC